MFHLNLLKDRNIPTLYEKVHDFWDTLYIPMYLKKAIGLPIFFV